jgi:hypothetical protein
LNVEAMTNHIFIKQIHMFGWNHTHTLVWPPVRIIRTRHPRKIKGVTPVTRLQASKSSGSRSWVI